MDPDTRDFLFELFVFKQYVEHGTRLQQRRNITSNSVSHMLGMADCIYVSYLDGAASLQVTGLKGVHARFDRQGHSP